jgi:hypothetical protein
MIITYPERHTFDLPARASGVTVTVKISNMSLTKTNYIAQSPSLKPAVYHMVFLYFLAKSSTLVLSSQNTLTLLTSTLKVTGCIFYRNFGM